MPISLYNSLTRKKEEFKPIRQGFANMYVCGPTVYGPPHVGHARSYTNFDVIRRYFEYCGYKVKYVQNITDVGHLVGDCDDGEDKIIVQATKEGIDPFELAYKFETIYFKYMDMLNIKRPSISARATGFIPEMIDLITKIIEKGFAYVTKQGNVYFSVRKFRDYGKLSGRKIDQNLSGERIEIADDKENPEDFALWKAAVGGHIMKWNSPWSVGYPGWHIECSTISKKFLGDTFDIHGGGLDNIFPHHESEIAQSEIANGKPFVNYFMHNNLITVNGTKMGKSLGNFITLEELFNQFNPLSVRYFILQFHYRKPVDFSVEAIKQADEQYKKICDILSRIKSHKLTEEQITDFNLVSIKNSFITAMNDDFNTPVAIAELIKFSKIVSKIVDYNDESKFGQIITLINMFESILGLKFDLKEQTKESNETGVLLDLISEVREILRQNKNYELSDMIRNKLSELDITISDKKLN